MTCVSDQGSQHIWSLINGSPTMATKVYIYKIPKNYNLSAYLFIVSDVCINYSLIIFIYACFTSGKQCYYNFKSNQLWWCVKCYE